MLASLLPGIRELRAPLAAGYVWIVTLWLAFGSRLPSSAEATGGLADVYRLADWVGRAGVFAAVSFTAYLLGIFSIALMSLIVRVGDLIRRTRLSPISPGYWRGRQVGGQVQHAVMTRLSERFVVDDTFRHRLLEHLRTVKDRTMRESASNPGHLVFPLDEKEPDELVSMAVNHPWRRWSLLESIVNVEKYVTEAETDLWHLGQRLIGKEEEVYAENNRLRAEHSFRIGLVLPLACLFVVLGFRIEPYWLLGILVSVWLLYLAVSSAAQADLQLVGLLAARRIDSPAIERLDTTQIEFLPYEELRVAHDGRRRTA